jgi:hypothetical protein
MLTESLTEALLTLTHHIRGCSINLIKNAHKPANSGILKFDGSVARSNLLPYAVVAVPNVPFWISMAFAVGRAGPFCNDETMGTGGTLDG